MLNDAVIGGTLGTLHNTPGDDEWAGNMLTAVLVPIVQLTLTSIFDPLQCFITLGDLIWSNFEHTGIQKYWLSGPWWVAASGLGWVWRQGVTDWLAWLEAVMSGCDAFSWCLVFLPWGGRLYDGNMTTWLAFVKHIFHGTQARIWLASRVAILMLLLNTCKPYTDFFIPISIAIAHIASSTTCHSVS